MERPGVVLENGHPTHITWAVADVDKDNKIPGNSNHGSKIIVVPFDGVAFDAHFGDGTTDGSGGAEGSGGAQTGGTTGAGGGDLSGTGGALSTGGSAPGTGGGSPAGGMNGLSTGGNPATGGSSETGGMMSGGTASGGSDPLGSNGATSEASSGCSCRLGRNRISSMDPWALFGAVGLVGLWVRRRRVKMGQSDMAEGRLRSVP